MGHIPSNWWQHVVWHHSVAEDPVDLYSEIVDGWEKRKIEVYADGHAGFAEPGRNSLGTLLAEDIMPDMEMINAQAEFSGRYITREVFEQLWAKHVIDFE